MLLFSRSNLFSVIVIFLVYFLIRNECGPHENRKTLKHYKKKSYVQLVFTRNHTSNNVTANRKDLCRWLRNLKHQHRLCIRRKGLDEAIVQSKKLTVKSCVEHFRYEQWACVRLKKFFKKVYRETAFMYSLATSAFMFIVAKACAAGNLENCSCASHGRSDNSSWQWGGCGDNTKYAKALTYKFFQLRKKGDKMQNVLRFNSELAVKVVMRNEEKICRCHGISGSCSLKLCFKRIRSFDKIVEDLRTHYHNALKEDSDNSIIELRKMGVHGRLLYLEESPSFCPQASGRRCQDEDNCATICCGRDFVREAEIVKERCKCRLNQTTLQVKCELCQREQSIFICK